MKKIIAFIIALVFFAWFWYAQSYTIIPSSNTGTNDIIQKVKDISDAWWRVREEYDDKYESIKNDLWAQFASWIMSWDTLLNFAAYVVWWMSQIWLIIWALMIIYSWYLYASSVFTWNATKWAEPVRNAIIWIIIIIFSYAIIKIVSEMFL